MEGPYDDDGGGDDDGDAVPRLHEEGLDPVLVSLEVVEVELLGVLELVGRRRPREGEGLAPVRRRGEA